MKREPPPILGGQGRSSQSVAESGDWLAILLVVVACLLAWATIWKVLT